MVPRSRSISSCSSFALRNRSLTTDIDRVRTALGPLEKHMLEKMRQTVLFFRLIARTHTSHHDDRRRLRIRHRRQDDPKPVLQCVFLIFHICRGIMNKESRIKLELFCKKLLETFYRHALLPHRVAVADRDGIGERSVLSGADSVEIDGHAVRRPDLVLPAVALAHVAIVIEFAHPLSIQLLEYFFGFRD